MYRHAIHVNKIITKIMIVRLRIHWDLASVNICLAVLSQFIELREITLSHNCITNVCDGNMICSIFKLL